MWQASVCLAALTPFLQQQSLHLQLHQIGGMEEDEEEIEKDGVTGEEKEGDEKGRNRVGCSKWRLRKGGGSTSTVHIHM